MYSKILFGVADDEALTEAVPVVAAYARKLGAEVRVLHVHQLDRDAPNASSRRLVTAVVDRMRSEGVSAEGEIRLVRHGERVGPVIATTARQAGVDLVAIGSRGRSDLGALFLGSVSHDALGGLDIPVLVVGSRSTALIEPRTVVVGTDGSAASDEAAIEAADLAASFGAAVVVVHVSQLTAVEGVTIVEREEDAKEIVHRAAATVAARGVVVTSEVSVDLSTANGLVAAAERHHADVVVLGSRRPSHLGGLVLGSVAHEAIHRLHCPVLLARRVRSAKPVG